MPSPGRGGDVGDDASEPFQMGLARPGRNRSWVRSMNERMALALNLGLSAYLMVPLTNLVDPAFQARGLWVLYPDDLFPVVSMMAALWLTGSGAYWVARRKAYAMIIPFSVGVAFLAVLLRFAAMES